MGEIKSVWEIVRERVERLGKLSPEEIRRQREEKCNLLGEVLAEKYLSGLDLWQLEVELGKYSGEEADLVKKAVASRLVQAIEVGDYEKLEKVIIGISYLKPSEEVKKIGERIKSLFREYRQEEEREWEGIEKEGRELLHQLRISGEAIEEINPKARSEWEQRLERVVQPYKERLEELKRGLEIEDTGH